MIVKLCGLPDLEALRGAGAARPEAVGFVLAPSVRQVALETLPGLLSAVPYDVERWAVFGDVDPDAVRALEGLGLTGVQGHVGWDGAGLPAGMAFLPVYRDHEGLLDTLRDDGFDGRIRAVRGLRGAFVVDGAQGGGRGQPVDRQRAAAASQLGPLVLAGGLDPDNVADAVRAVRPYAVDVSSGIERARGVKDPARMRAFAEAARAAARGE